MNEEKDNLTPESDENTDLDLTEETTEIGLAVSSVPILPVVSPEQVKMFQRQLTALKESILKVGVDYVIDTIKGKKVTIFHKTGWEKIAAFFGISTKVISKEYREFEAVAKKIIRDKDTDKIIKREIIFDKEGNPLIRKYYAYEYNVNAFCGDRSNDAVGACSSNEEKVFHHPMHDVMATAHTRAKSRAICAMIGAGLSYEEIEGITESTKKRTIRPPPKQQQKILRSQ